MNSTPWHEQRCRTCRFYVDDKNPKETRCAAHPPKVRFDGTYWPHVEENDWCGEWRGKVDISECKSYGVEESAPF